MKIKICGVREQETAEACAQERVDYVGLNFVRGRRRAIEPALGARLAAQVRRSSPHTQIVGVFLDQSRETIADIHRTVGLDLIQLHGSESPDFAAAIAHECPVIKAFQIDAHFEPTAVDAYLDAIWALLFDSKAPGSGVTADWTQIPAVPEDRLRFLAGGLNAENVQDAIRAVGPDVVDTASGAENSGGLPDAGQVRAFCNAVRTR